MKVPVEWWVGIVEARRDHVRWSFDVIGANIAATTA